MDEFIQLMKTAMPVLHQVCDALPALQDFKEWHAREKERIEAQRLADEEHDRQFADWQKRHDEEEANRQKHMERIKPLLR
ncbi:MAG: hypothetical protein IJ243_02510 [Prevotella sp.]|nr:hypothetical protein [Prevotella sp.]